MALSAVSVQKEPCITLVLSAAVTIPREGGVLSCEVLSCEVLSCEVLSCEVLSCEVLSWSLCAVLSWSLRACASASCTHVTVL